ncbi:molybdopterin molybdotransferase MoeA [Corynebacterium suicordis]
MAHHTETPRTPEEHARAVSSCFAAPETVHIPAHEALGRRLAASVQAATDSPTFDNSQMDGYALAEEHLAGGRFEVGETVAAGVDPKNTYPHGLKRQVAPVMTGAMVPARTVAVVPVERCEPADFAETGATVEVPAMPRGQFVRLRSSDIVAGSELYPAGHVVNARTVGAATLQGIATLPVRAKARVLLCTGGDEIGGSGVASIPDTNYPLLVALCQRFHIEVAGHVRTSDDPAEFERKLRAAIAEHQPTAVVTSGGISHGKFEVVRQVLDGDTGWFGHVAQQPGGPQGLSSFAGVPVISLPGNPVSTAVSFRLFVAPALGESLEPIVVVAGENMNSLEGKDRFAHARQVVRDGQVIAEPVGGASSHLLAQSVEADLLVRIPEGQNVRAGDKVTAYPL